MFDIVEEELETEGKIHVVLALEEDKEAAGLPSALSPGLPSWWVDWLSYRQPTRSFCKRHWWTYQARPESVKCLAVLPFW